MVDSSKQTEMWNRVILGVLAAAFMAWAGVVWRAVAVIETSLASIQTEVRVNQEQDRLNHSTMNQHVAQPWHGQAGNELSRIRAEMESLRRELERANHWSKNIEEPR